MKPREPNGGRVYALGAGIVVLVALGLVRISTHDAPTGASTPQGAVRAYYRALEAGDCRRAGRFVHPEFLEADRLCERFRETRNLSGRLLEVLSTQVTGETARVVIQREIQGVRDRRFVRARLAGGLWTLAGGSSCHPVQHPTDLGALHLEPGQEFDSYSSFPPTSGPHDPTPAEVGAIYESPQPLPPLVHSMEHGAVIFWVGSAPPGMREQLLGVVQGLFQAGYEAMVVTPLPVLQVPFAVTAWGTLQRCLGVSPSEVRAFVETYYGSGGEGRLACRGRAAGLPPCGVEA